MKQRETTNCPNCGAPIAADKCPYCGTMILDFSCIDAAAENWIKIKTHGRIYMVKARLIEQEMTMRPVYADYFADNRVVLTRQLHQDMELGLRFFVIPDDDGVMYREVRTDGN